MDLLLLLRSEQDITSAFFSKAESWKLDKFGLQEVLRSLVVVAMLLSYLLVGKSPNIPVVLVRWGICYLSQITS